MDGEAGWGVDDRASRNVLAILNCWSMNQVMRRKSLEY